jgi:hypothetical protein
MKKKLFGRMDVIENLMAFEQDTMFQLEDFIIFFFSWYLFFIQVVTIAEKPFIFSRPGNDCTATEVYCPRKKLDSNISKLYQIEFIVLNTYLDTTGGEYEQYCCYGYCIDLLQELSKNLSFVYTLHLVADGKYGSFEKVIRIAQHFFRF